MAPKKINTAAPAPAADAVPVVPSEVTPPVDAPADAPVDTPVETTDAPVETAAPAPLTTAEKVSALAKLLDVAFIAAKDNANKLKQAHKEALQLLKEVAQLEKDKGRKSKGRAAKAAAAAALEGGAPVPPRRPSGFATPATLSSQLSEFLGVPVGTKMARTDVTRMITEYVKNNKLHDEKDRRIIRSDEKLQQILGSSSDGKPLTYFNLQTHIKHHFIRSDAAPSPALTVAAEPVVA